jgi:predicted O-methyltransferase YrrM
MAGSLRNWVARRRDEALRPSAERDSRTEALLCDTRYEDIEALLDQSDSSWSISSDLARLLARAVIELGLSSVLELGAGFSSRILSASLSHLAGGRLTSVEQNTDWCLEHWNLVRTIWNVDSLLVECKPSLSLSAAGLSYEFREATGAIASRAPYDLVLVDAPQGFYGRDGVLRMIQGHLSSGALVVLDDAGRAGERWALFRNLRTAPGYRLLLYDSEFGRRGCAVLGPGSARWPRLSLLGVSSSVIQTIVYARRRHRRQAERPEWT